jgi:hypothetical protein
MEAAADPVRPLVDAGRVVAVAHFHMVIILQLFQELRIL